MITIMLDAGHGGNDSGAVNGKRYEKDDTLKFTLELRDILKRCGVNVLLTRSIDVYVSLSERVTVERMNKIDYFVSIHRNSADSNKANGFEVFSHSITGKGRELASKVNEEIKALKLFTDRGLKTANFTVIAQTKAPAILMELGFISNDTDNILYDANYKTILASVAKGICRQVNIPFVEEKPSNEPTSSKNTMYRVVVDTYSNKSNAIERQKELKTKYDLKTFIAAYEVK